MRMRRVACCVMCFMPVVGGAPVLGWAHEAPDPLHSVPVEMVGSPLAKVTDVHVEQTAAGVGVRGVVKRKGHDQRRLLGHIDVEIVDANGAVVAASQGVAMTPRFRSVKHDHQRQFSVTVPVSNLTDYRVRVRHALVDGGH